MHVVVLFCCGHSCLLRLFLCVVAIYYIIIPLQISSTKQGGLGSVQTVFTMVNVQKLEVGYIVKRVEPEVFVPRMVFSMVRLGCFVEVNVWSENK